MTQGEEVLPGGVANAGSVTRAGDYVLRPANAHTPSVHRFLRAVRESGFFGASQPVGVDSDGRERLVFIEGEVAIPPYPPWAQLDSALASIAALLRGFHAASTSFDPAGSTWSDEMADPVGGAIVCHNDVCLENVVFDHGVAIGLVDFDFAAPGRPIYDLAQMARMGVPIDDDASAARVGWEPADRAERLRLVADAYGLGPAARHDMLAILSASIARGGAFVRARVDAGDPNFVRMWDEMGGQERFDRRARWWAESQDRFVRALE
ncbi:MAG TPA: phosphotransferase [Acidimicrobiia bacterium]|nr:phosphotransferase [Acidimicrobiia bacterium]